MAPDLYPNCDFQTWLRTANKETLLPIAGEIVYGGIPEWVDGLLIRNGPGGPNAHGDAQCRHVFDGPGLLHKFEIRDGRALYTNKYVGTQSYQRNREAGRLVMNEFGTYARPDPCQTIFQRYATSRNCYLQKMLPPKAYGLAGSNISGGENPHFWRLHLSFIVMALFTFRMDRIFTDTANISIHPFGNEIYALAETPFAHRIDRDTLETLATVNVHDEHGLINHSSHPHIESCGQIVYNLGQRFHLLHWPNYIITEIRCENGESRDTVNASPWSKAQVVAEVPSRWPLSLCYMHTFSLTPNYFVIIEQPLAVSLPSIPYNFLVGQKPIAGSLQFFPDQDTLFHVISRRDPGTRLTFRSPAFFFMHTINAFEEELGGETYVVLDICTYNDPKLLELMYVEALKTAQSNPDYGNMFRARPNRFRLNLSRSSSKVLVRPERIVDIGCELPQIHYAAYNGKPYRYFYAISSDVDAENPGTLIKVDTHSGTFRTWSERNAYPSEPVFIPHPTLIAEDSGLILSAVLYGGQSKSGSGPNNISLIILDARKWELVSKIDFRTESEIPKCLHGWFFPNKEKEAKTIQSSENQIKAVN